MAVARAIPACYAQHEHLARNAWHLLEQLPRARFTPTEDDNGKPCLLELRNCPDCHSTLSREVPLMSIADAEAEALRVWRAKTGLVRGELAAFELRSMARPYFTGVNE